MGRLSEFDHDDVGAPLLASLDARIEALVVASPRPLALAEIKRALPHGTDVEGALGRISGFWEGRGAELVETPDGFTIRARAGLAPVEKVGQARRLSESAMATLAVIAMHQPISVAQIEKVRSVKLARGIIEWLVEAHLVEEVDRRRGTGRAKLYGTTDAFLRATGLSALSDMPTPEEVIHTDIVD